MKKITKIRWVIAHEPISLFFRAAKDFEASINQQQSAEQIEIEIMTPAEYSYKYNDGIMITKHDLLDLMDQGRIEMSQMYTTWLAETYAPDMLAFEMPFIFRDHDHATRVLEGPIGESLLDSIKKNSKLRGLSYTYSGGFRMATVNKKVNTLAELSGLTMRSNRNPVAQAMWRNMDMTPFVCEIEDTKDKFEQDLIDAADTVFSRVYPLGLDAHTQSVVDSKHTLFLTTMLISDSFWEQLSDEVKSIIKTAAIDAGRKERVETIQDGDQARQKLIKSGVTVFEPTREEMDEFRARMQTVYDEFTNTFQPGLIDAIKKS